jgi:hypothetical protein
MALLPARGKCNDQLGKRLFADCCNSEVIIAEVADLKLDFGWIRLDFGVHLSARRGRQSKEESHGSVAGPTCRLTPWRAAVSQSLGVSITVLR